MRRADSIELDGFISQSHGLCMSSHDDGALLFLLVLGAIQFAMLVDGLFLCYRVRKAPTQYAETKYIFFALGSQLQFKLFFLMLSTSVYGQRLLWYLLRWFTVIITDGGTLWLIFLPKVLLLRKHKDGKMATAKNKFVLQALKLVRQPPLSPAPCGPLLGPRLACA